MDQVIAPLKKIEIQELRDYLTKYYIEQDGMELEEAHGYIAGLICGPETLHPALWIEDIFNGPTEFESEEHELRIMDYLYRLYHLTVYCIENEELFSADYYPIHPKHAKKSPDFKAIRAWCQGFVGGASHEDWNDIPSFTMIIFPILISLSPDDNPILKEICAQRKQSLKAVRKYFIECIPSTICNLYQYIHCVKYEPISTMFKQISSEEHECDENCLNVH